MSESSEPGRILVVGCPRSGTTLLQSMLAAHPEVLAFPETHLMWGLESVNPLRRRARIRGRDGADTWRELPTLGVPVRGRAPRLVGPYVRRAFAAMDDAARAAGKSAWSEKTPGHLRSLYLVDRYAPTTRVVHVVRAGLPAVTSLFAVTQDHGPAWNGARPLDLCVTRWRKDLARTASWAADPRHSVVAYESLVADPGRVLAALSTALRLAGDMEASVDVMLSTYRVRAAAVTSRGESWKEDVQRPLVDRSRAREGLLDDRQRQQVLAAVAECAATYAALPFLVAPPAAG